jgi:hypothetical protein
MKVVICGNNVFIVVEFFQAKARDDTSSKPTTMAAEDTGKVG